METITTALSTSFTAVQSNAESLIATGLPYALAVAGVVIAIRLGWKTFKGFTK